MTKTQSICNKLTCGVSVSDGEYVDCETLLEEDILTKLVAI